MRTAANWRDRVGFFSGFRLGKTPAHGLRLPMRTAANWRARAVLLLGVLPGQTPAHGPWLRMRTAANWRDWAGFFTGFCLGTALPRTAASYENSGKLAGPGWLLFGFCLGIVPARILRDHPPDGSNPRKRAPRGLSPQRSPTASLPARAYSAPGSSVTWKSTSSGTRYCGSSSGPQLLDPTPAWAKSTQSTVSSTGTSAKLCFFCVSSSCV